MDGNIPAGVKRYALYLLIMAGLGGLIYGIDVGVIAAALPYIERTSTFTQDEIGWIVGMALPMYFGFRDAYMESLRPGYGDAYVEALTGLTPSWTFWALIVTIFVGGLLGGLVGTKILKKHFVKAGMA